MIVKGKLLFPQKLPIDKGDMVTVVFKPEEKGVLASSAVYSADDGSFEAKGLDGKGLLPGKYKVSVSVVIPPGSKNPLRSEDLKDFNKKYDPGNSPLSIEIAPDTTSITVDTDAGTVTKG